MQMNAVEQACTIRFSLRILSLILNTPMVSMFSTDIKKSPKMKQKCEHVRVKSNFLHQSQLTYKMYVPHPQSTSANFLVYFNIVLTHVFKQTKVTKFRDTLKPS